jgi:hypothetical protein
MTPMLVNLRWGYRASLRATKAGVTGYACLFIVAGALSAPRVWPGRRGINSIQIVWSR